MLRVEPQTSCLTITLNHYTDWASIVKGVNVCAEQSMSYHFPGGSWQRILSIWKKVK